MPGLGDFARRAVQGRTKALVIGGANASGTERLERPLLELRRAGIQCIAANASKVAILQAHLVGGLVRLCSV